MMNLIEAIMIKAFNVWRAAIIFVLNVVLAILVLVMVGIESIVLVIEGDFDGVAEECETVIKVIKGMFVKCREEEEEDTPE